MVSHWQQNLACKASKTTGKQRQDPDSLDWLEKVISTTLLPGGLEQALCPSWFGIEARKLTLSHLQLPPESHLGIEPICDISLPPLSPRAVHTFYAAAGTPS